MSNDRIDSLNRMLERSPGDVRARLGLAMEYEKLARWHDVARELQLYLAASEDQGNAWGRLGHALIQIGDTDAARAAYRNGIEAAARHGHPSMAAEFQETLEDLDP
ncbi:MAG TPA: hypothetical protein VK939_01675 [Longimicrobiales bacterium]|nr:hypothetical protein [Longimicrobiales bacterium]